MSNGDLYQWCYDGINSEWFLQVNNSAMDDITSPETFEADLKTAVEPVRKTSPDSVKGQYLERKSCR